MPPIWNTVQSLFKKISGKVPVGAALPMPVVALIRDHHDRSLLAAIGKRDHLDVHFADTCNEAWDAANRLLSPVVLCARDVSGMEWPDAVRILASAVPRPCVILTSPVADDYLWKEIVARGGYDVLATPLRDVDASRSIKLALSYWKNTSRGHAHHPAFRK